MLSDRARACVRGVSRGAVAGAAGTTALNAVTYADMALRGRPSSSTPEQTVEKLSDVTHVPVPGHGDTRSHRVSGLGPLMGLAAGVGTGALLGLGRSAGWRPGLVAGGTAAALVAMVAGSGPMTLLRVTDPRSWGASDWLSDAVPHAAYGALTAWTLQRLGDD
ncbi:hypothetical protein [Streptomyces sp. RFCAC02]|uniref:hypothetical protein n=1 Tax=Streptomyces sp. RFCAC02 TaxID=2499143 RepID=UPI00101ECF73|nr:hypothetical protein [Streptomyces sp. RFCAC02]